VRHPKAGGRITLWGRCLAVTGDTRADGSVHGETMPLDRRDRVLDWHDELRRLAPRLAELPLAARLAIAEVVATFAREDAMEPREPAQDAASGAISNAA